MFECSLCFSLALFGLPLFQFLFLCLFFSFFLPSFLSFFFVFWFVPCFCLFVFFFHCFCFMKEQHQKIQFESMFSHPSFLLSLVSCLAFSFKSIFLLFGLLTLSYVFVQHQCYWFQNKNTNCWSRGGCNKTVFFC